MIEIKGIKKSFGTLEVLKGIDLTINKGEIVSIVGPSGAGKTTLLQIIGTLDRPDAGTVCIDSIDTTQLSQKKLSDFRNRHIGFVFQFHQLLPEFTALENVMIPAYIAGTSTKEARRRAEELLQFMGLSNRASHKPNELSGGEKQRIAIARMILKNAPIVILDEATAFTDQENEEKIQQSIAALTKGKTLLVIAHRLSTVKNADQIIVLENGMVNSVGTHEKLLSDGGLYKAMWDAHIGAQHWSAGSVERG